MSKTTLRVRAAPAGNRSSGPFLSHLTRFRCLSLRMCCAEKRHCVSGQRPADRVRRQPTSGRMVMQQGRMREEFLARTAHGRNYAMCVSSRRSCFAVIPERINRESMSIQGRGVSRDTTLPSLRGSALRDRGNLSFPICHSECLYLPQRSFFIGRSFSEVRSEVRSEAGGAGGIYFCIHSCSHPACPASCPAQPSCQARCADGEKCCGYTIEYGRKIQNIRLD